MKTEQTLSNNKRAKTSHIKVGHADGGERQAVPEKAVTWPPRQLGGAGDGKRLVGETDMSSRHLKATAGSWDSQGASKASFGSTRAVTPVQLLCKGRASFSKRSLTEGSLYCFLLNA